MGMDIGLNKKPYKNKFSLKDFFQSDAFMQMTFAISSGIFIFLGWLFSKLELSTLSVISFLLAYGIGGYFKAKEGIQDTIETKKLNVELLMVLAAIGSAIIGYWEEGAILIFIFALSGALETFTMNKSNKELSSLMQLQPEEAWLLTNGQEVRVPVQQLNVGDTILVKPGEQIPVDGIIKKGHSQINQATITGESIPVEKSINDEVFAGTLNGSGAITVEITKPNSETLFQKIVQLVQSAQSEKSPSQQFIDRFEGVYVNVVLIFVALMMVLPPFLFDWSWNETFYRAMVLLVVASPCAVVASITPAALSAISNGAKNGILFKGSIHLENLAKVQAISFDKTGTITKGIPEVTDFIVISPFDERYILGIAAAIESQSNHPLAQAVVKYAKKQQISELPTPEYVEDVSGWGLKAKVDGANWKIGKRLFVEQSTAFDFEEYNYLSEEGKTIVFIQKNEQIAGIIAFQDVLRNEAKETIDALKKLGITPIMLTGDNHHTAKTIAKETGIETFVADCLPEKKVQEIKKIQEKYGVCAMVGDGINDAPALATAQVGIAMGEGTDVALETADVVLMKNDLSKIIKALRISKKMSRIVKQNLIFSVAVILLLIVSNFMQTIDLPLGVIGHEGSTILVILNSLRLLKNS